MPVIDFLERNVKLYGNETALVELNPEIKDFYQFTPDDVKLEGYQTGEQIKDIPIAI